MSMVTQFSWDDIADPAFENPARTAWREAVAEVAEKAKATLPECNGRLDSAVKIVLAGDVELLEDGTAKVASQSNGSTAYFVVNGECSCQDHPKAPQGFCKHRLAYGIHKRASTLAKQRLAQLDSAQHATSQPTREQSTPDAVHDAIAVSLPEAPASVNVHVMLHGRQVQVTLRDSDEHHLLERLERLLQHFPVEDAKPEPPAGWCSKHGVQMKHKHSEKGSWWYHKTADGQWCHG